MKPALATGAKPLAHAAARVERVCASNQAHGPVAFRRVMHDFVQAGSRLVDAVANGQNPTRRDLKAAVETVRLTRLTAERVHHERYWSWDPIAIDIPRGTPNDYAIPHLASLRRRISDLLSHAQRWHAIDDATRGFLAPALAAATGNRIPFGPILTAPGTDDRYPAEPPSLRILIVHQAPQGVLDPEPLSELRRDLRPALAERGVDLVPTLTFVHCSEWPYRLYPDPGPS